MSTVSYVSEKTYWEWSTRGFPEATDVLITTEAPVGEVAPFPCDQTYLITRRVFAMRGKKGVLDNAYLLYTCLSSIVQDELQSRIRGSTVPRVLKTDILGLQIPLPCLSEQKAIAHILGTLDAKIELNRKTNETLEAMAKALFKSWFIDFDPVRAKAEGRSTGLQDEISDLFPDSFEDSELGEVPSGWKFTPIFDLADYVNGASHSSEHLNHVRRGLPIIKIAELKNGITEQTKHWDSEYKEKHVVVEGDILFSWSGNPDTSIGTFVWGKERGLLNQHIFKVVPRQQAQHSFILLLLKQNQTHFAAIARDKQTTGLGHVTVKDLKETVCPYPSLPLMKAFAQMVDGFVDQCQHLILQNDSLGNLRDALLPKLISGEIRIPDAEKMLEEVGV